MKNNLNKNIENLKVPITAYGIYFAVAVTLMIIALLYFLRLDNIPIVKLLWHYYTK